MSLDYARQVRRVSIGPGRVRIRVVLTGPTCQAHTERARVAQAQMLQAVARDPTLLACGYQPFEKAVITHNGTCWQVEAEADVDEEA